jgi:hypothetical protein
MSPHVRAHSVDDFMNAVRTAIRTLPQSDVVVITDTSDPGRVMAGVVTGIRCFVPIALSYGFGFDGRRPPAADPGDRDGGPAQAVGPGAGGPAAGGRSDVRPPAPAGPAVASDR